LKRPKKLIIATTKKAPLQKIRALESKGARVIVCSMQNGKVSIKDMMKKLSQLKITSILLESASALAKASLAEGIVDKMIVFMSPHALGKGMAADIGMNLKEIRLKYPCVKHIGEDIMIEGYLR